MENRTYDEIIGQMEKAKGDPSLARIGKNATFTNKSKTDSLSHVHYSFGSLFKSYCNILGLPYLNQYDAGTSDLSGFFTNTPDFTPYNALAVDKRIFDPQKALDPFDEKFDWKAIGESPQINNVEDILHESKEQDAYRLENREKVK